ncbi:MAG: ABC transporter ATP-binding protein [Ruminococcaceae bacterium]|nr:ABC transporter ATP-binding protein [Oscillospiraceae bacterium]
MIDVIGVSKKFKRYHDKATTLKERLLMLRSSKSDTFLALENINLHIDQGETVGLIGHNGSGKSTLLKLITKIIYPTEGKITTKGRVSSLLELGAGFHPDFTGRENIYINASIFGLSKKEIDKKLDSIIAFSELEGFIDSPIRTYSSGMYIRLAFAVAVHVEPQILLMDEILAVGDANFQKKCINKIKEFKKQGITIVFVSHNMEDVYQICDRVVWLDHGHIKAIGNTKEIGEQYLAAMAQNEGDN